MTAIGVVAALPFELRALGSARDGLLRAADGPGPERARAAALALIDRGAVALVSFGFAGALDPDCAPGDLLLPRSVRTTAGSTMPCDPDWRARLAARLGDGSRVRDGILLASRTVLQTKAAKAAARGTGAVGVDQESGAVGEVAAERGVRFVVLRAVCDPADLELPDAALAAVGPDGRLRPFALCARLLRRPAEIGGLLRLRSASARARAALAVAVRRAGPDLGCP